MDFRVIGLLFFLDRIAAYLKKGTCGELSHEGVDLSLRGVKFGIPRESNPQSEIASFGSQ